MATVTKMIRWVDSPAGGDARSIEGSNGSPVARVCNGLRMEVHPSLVRDTGCGSKLFALIPPGIKTVRGFKNHLSTKILKTHVPFYFYDGEYRIPDEEDIRVFMLLSEPCRVVPVPQPKSALSSSSANGSSTAVVTSTPLLNGSPHNNSHSPPCPKRVKFSDSLDVSGFCIRSMAMGSCSDTQDAVDSNIHEMVEEDSPVKKQRKRRHRKHKDKAKKKLMIQDDNEAETASIDSGDLDCEDGAAVLNENKTRSILQIGKEKRNTPKPRKSVSLIQEYDADESDLSQKSQKGSTSSVRSVSSNGVHNPQLQKSQCTVLNKRNSQTVVGQQGNKEFLSPNTVFSETGYKRLRNSTSATKPSFSKDNHHQTPSFSSGYGSSSTPAYVEIDDNSGGRRQDTPMLPKVLKNPCATYELVKKSLNFERRSAVHEEDGSDDAEVEQHNSEEERANEKTDDAEIAKDEVLESQGTDANGQIFEEILNVEEIAVGSRIKFQVLEIGENYTPELSQMKFAEVLHIDGPTLTLKYEVNGNQRKQRSGVLEIEDEDIRVESLDDPAERKFSDLIKPCLVFTLENGNNV